MNAQTTFSKTHAMHYSRAAVSAPSRRSERRFWLIVYAILVFLIVAVLGTAALLFGWSGYLPVSAASVDRTVVTAQPVENLPLAEPPASQPEPTIVQDADQGAVPTPGALGESAPTQPVQVEVTPVQPMPTAEVAQPEAPQPEEVQPEEVQPEVSQPTTQPEPVVEPTATAEPLEEPTNRQIYLGMEDDYHSQLSVPNGRSACGPAALLIALDYYDLQSSLPELIAQASFDPRAGGYDPTCTDNVVCTSPQALARLASAEYGLDVQAGEGWTFEQVYAALEAGSPVIADVAWDASTTSLGHFVVIYGIDPENQIVYYHDPYYGAGLSATWEAFNYRWSHTVDVGDPLQAGGYTRWGMAIYMR